MSGSLVLLSGGLDSTAALLLEVKHGRSTVEALFIHYGQPMAWQEHAAAERACRELGVPLHEVDVADVFAAFRGGLMASPASGRDAAGVDTAFLPGRNAVLLSVAASVACQRNWMNATLVVGFNSDDAAGFPDCRPEFCRGLSLALRAGGASVRIVAPFITSSKRRIVDWVRRECPGLGVSLVEGSWSCYRGDGPCGACTACVTRAAAFAPEP